MSRSFVVVDNKLFESDFFLTKICGTKSPYEVIFYFNAFLSAARSVTFCLQASMNSVNGFEEWYNSVQKELSENKLAKFFHTARNESQKEGVHHITSGTFGNDRIKFYFQLPATLNNSLPESAVDELCKQYFLLLLKIIYACYQRFGPIIDPAQYYTLENIKKMNKSIEDIEEEIGFSGGWTKGIPDSERIRLLRESESDSNIDELFLKYLGMTRSSWRSKEAYVNPFK